MPILVYGRRRANKNRAECAIPNTCRDILRAGEPVIRRHAHGNGVGYYVETSLDPDGIDWLIGQVVI